MKLSALNAVVTGGGSGLVEATVRAIAEAGGNAVILDLAKSKGAGIADELGKQVVFCETDVTKEDQVTAALDTAIDHFGSLHAAISCAGIGSAGRTIGRNNEPFKLDLFRLTIEISLIGTFNVIRLAAARMSQNDPNEDGERGVIINTASVAAYDGQIGQCAYSASKGGVVAMTLPIARDLSRYGIRVMTIAPGLFETPMLMGLPEPARDALGASIPFPSRLGRPAEYASLACQIIENPMLNGEVIRLDGAIRMAPK